MLKEATIVAVIGTAITNLLIVPMDIIIAGKAMPETWASYAIGLLSLIVSCWMIASMLIEKAKITAYKNGYNRGHRDRSIESYWEHEGSAEAEISRILK